MYAIILKCTFELNGSASTVAPTVGKMFSGNKSHISGGGETRPLFFNCWSQCPVEASGKVIAFCTLFHQGLVLKDKLPLDMEIPFSHYS